MPSFSRVSLARLATCDSRLQSVCHAAIERIDFTVLCGFRNERDQNDAFERGFSKVKWPNGRHNKMPSQAVDLAPYPINWSDIDRFKALAMVMLDEAKALGVKLRWGGDFNRNGLSDDKFGDMPHFEIDQ